MMKHQFPLSVVDPEVNFSHLLHDPEHSDSNLFGGLEKIPLHVEEDSSGVEHWLNEGVMATDATVSIV